MSRAKAKTPSPNPATLRADQVERGPQFSPEQLVTLYTPDEWELFIRDWAEILKGKYHTVERLGGAGDEGRDIVAYYGPPKSAGKWDNFQAKHYNRPLMPSDIWLELGKLCYHTFKLRYSIPNEYKLVAPRDIGTKLWNLIHHPKLLRAQLIAEWDRHCLRAITQKSTIPLTGDLKAHVESFDFSIVDYLPIREILKQFRNSPYYVTRFGGGLPPRPPVSAPPADPTRMETRYVRQLLNAYGDAMSCEITSPDRLKDGSVHKRHFSRCREDFYRAESLQVFSRATVPPGTFESLQDEVYRGVIDVAESVHRDGFERVKATTTTARALPIHSHALVSVLTHDDKSGICHQLANVNRITWVITK